MTELYLIAHKVRGAIGFDIAERCIFEHNGEEYWLISTSGWRAYPFWFHKLFDLYNSPHEGSLCVYEMMGTMEPPSGLRDHFIASEPRITAVPRRNPQPRSLDDLIGDL